MPEGYSDKVHQARVFPRPPGARPARSLVYTRDGDTYKAAIGRPRRRYPGAAASGPAAAQASGGQESGNTVIAIMVTGEQVEIWSAEPARGWANPCLVRHEEITDIQYLGEGSAAVHSVHFPHGGNGVTHAGLLWLICLFKPGYFS
jgi:hypothetical protein